MIDLIVDNKEIIVKWLEFSDGALTCKLEGLEPDKEYRYASLSVCPSTPCKQVLEELGLVLLSLYHLKMDISKVYLHLPYLPYARADRKFERGNPIPLENFLSLLSNMCFDEISIADPHNEKALLDFYEGDAKLSVICAADESMSDAVNNNVKEVTEFSERLIKLGFNTRVFNPAGQDDIGGGCGQLWAVQQYANSKPEHFKQSAGNKIYCKNL